MKLLKQPYIIAYVVAGVLLGSNGLKVATDEAFVSNLGSFGLILLMFFIGMEISLPQLLANWRISIFGTLLQVLISIASVWVLGFALDWSMNRVLMMGFVISISSTAIVIKVLQDRNEIHTKAGKNALSILLAQDVLIIPMLIILNSLSGESPDSSEIVKQIVGGLFMIGIVVFMVRKKSIKLPFEDKVESDHELQIFIAIALCFGFSLLTAYFGLSSALGALVAGMFVSSAKATHWIHESLHSFRVVFVAIFFISIGMMIDLSFLQEYAPIIIALVLLVFLTNTFINASIMRFFGSNWRESLYTGAVLAQIGEFSFILGATGYGIGLINEFAYQLIISTISITLAISPFWITLAQKLVLRNRTLD